MGPYVKYHIFLSLHIVRSLSSFTLHVGFVTVPMLIRITYSTGRWREGAERFLPLARGTQGTPLIVTKISRIFKRRFKKV